MTDSHDLIQDLAHDVLGSLNSIETDGDKLYHFIDNWDQETIRHIALVIGATSRYAARRVRNYTWLSYGLHGPAELRGTATHIGQSVLACAKDAEAIADMDGVQVHVDMSSFAALPAISIDDHLFRWALANLLENAVKYAKELTKVSVAASQAKSEVRILVTDYGYHYMNRRRS